MGSGQGWIAAVVTLSLAMTASAEFRSIDGTGNHSSDPTFGSVDIQLLRLTDPAYQDGTSAPRGGDPSSLPSARAISNAVAAQSGSVLNARNLTDMAWLWGQFLDHDIDLTEGAKPDEPFNILVPVDDPYFGQPIMLNRSAFDPTTGTNTPRQQVNQITAYIDASNVYGSDSTRADALRTFTGGLLKTSAGNLLPFNTGGLPNADALGKGSDLFLAGDVRANENVALTGLHTLFLREHNRLAEDFDTRLNGADAGLTQMFNDSGLGRDEFLYQSARKVVGAQMQAITYNEFLPALLGSATLPTYGGYDDAVNPGIANEFSTAIYRLGHSLLSTTLKLDDGNVSSSLALRDAFFNPQFLIDNGIDALLYGSSLQVMQELDNQVVDDVRNFLFGPPGSGGFDLASLNIQRGRDHGLGSYTAVRADLGLDPIGSFLELTGGDSDLADALADVYATVDDIDLWVGALAEPHLDGSSVGELIAHVMIDQFTRLRDGDRFWYQNDAMLAQLVDMDLFEQLRLSDILMANTSLNGMRVDLFTVPEPGTLAILALAGALVGRRRSPRRRHRG